MNRADTINDSCFFIDGDNHRVTGNHAWACHLDGFEVIGKNHVLSGNTARGNHEDGFDVGAGASGVGLNDNDALRRRGPRPDSSRPPGL
jgi:hypothetical protein